MERFHFNTEDGATVVDEVGAELSDLQAARCESVRLLGEIIKNQPAEVLETKSFSVTVTDPTGLVLFILSLHAQDGAVVTPSAHKP